VKRRAGRGLVTIGFTWTGLWGIITHRVTEGSPGFEVPLYRYLELIEVDLFQVGVLFILFGGIIYLSSGSVDQRAVWH
jgi:hypothetical protein